MEYPLLFSRSENPGIELVVSEVRLAQLIARVIACLYGTTTHKRVSMRPPQFELPLILVDTRWMEHMLRHLLNHALIESPANAEISLEFHTDGETGEIVIDSRLSTNPHSEGFDELLRGLQRKPCGCSIKEFDSLALAKFCAHSLGHGLLGCIIDNNRLQLRVSNIRIS